LEWRGVKRGILTTKEKRATNEKIKVVFPIMLICLASPGRIRPRHSCSGIPWEISLVMENKGGLQVPEHLKLSSAAARISYSPSQRNFAHLFCFKLRKGYVS